MRTIRPFTGYLVDPKQVHEIVAPAYDSLTPQERHQFAVRHPRNYLNVIRSLQEFPQDERPTLEELLASNAAKLEKLIDDSAFVYHDRPCLYIYRIAVEGHVQTGVVAEISIAEYDAGKLRKHEHTRGDDEERLIKYLEAVRASSSPVCLAYRQRDEIDVLIDKLTIRESVVDFRSDDGVTHTIWRIADSRATDRLIELFAAVPVTYLTDGHHRSAATSRYAAKCRQENPHHTGDEAYSYLLVAMFPHDQLRIRPYNRCVRDLNGHALSDFLKELEKGFHVEKLQCNAAQAAQPTARGELSMLLDGCWYRLTVRPQVVPVGEPAQALDVVILQEQVLSPLLGIADPRSDPRLEYIPGSVDMSALEVSCERGWQVAFAAYPTSIEEMMEIADAGQVMPPKSTWFDPKVRSGIFLCRR